MPDQGEGATPALVRNHPFEPDGDWWTQCGTCGLSEVAHETTVLCSACGGAGGFPDEGACDMCEGTGRRP